MHNWRRRQVSTTGHSQIQKTSNETPSCVPQPRSDGCKGRRTKYTRRYTQYLTVISISIKRAFAGNLRVLSGTCVRVSQLQITEYGSIPVPHSTPPSNTLVSYAPQYRALYTSSKILRIPDTRMCASPQITGCTSVLQEYLRSKQYSNTGDTTVLQSTPCMSLPLHWKPFLQLQYYGGP